MRRLLPPRRALAVRSLDDVFLLRLGLRLLDWVLLARHVGLALLDLLLLLLLLLVVAVGGLVWMIHGCNNVAAAPARCTDKLPQPLLALSLGLEGGSVEIYNRRGLDRAGRVLAIGGSDLLDLLFYEQLTCRPAGLCTRSYQSQSQSCRTTPARVYLYILR